MHRIDHTTRDVDGNGTGKDGFTEGSPGTEAATVVTDDWLNDVQEEIANTVEGTGILLVKGTQDQLLEALQRHMTYLTFNNLTAYAMTGSKDVQDIHCANGYWVAVGDNGLVEYSTDQGENWTNNDQGTTYFSSVWYANGYWVAVGQSGALYYTTDPTGSWTSNTQGSENLTGVCHDGTNWVTVGDSGTVLHATDPTSGSWTSNTQGSGVPNFNACHFSGSYWVAVAQTGYLYYTTDPTGSWTANAQGSTTFNSVWCDGTYWAAAGSSGNFRYATDPTGSWTDNDQGSENLNDARALNGVWILVGADQTILIGLDITGTFNTHTYVNGSGINHEAIGIDSTNDRIIIGGDESDVYVSLKYLV